MMLPPLRRHALRIAGAATLTGALACRPATLTPVPVPVPAPDVAADSTPRRVPGERPCAIPMSDEEMRRAAWAGYRATFATLVDSLIGDPRFRSAHWGVLVVDPLTGDTIVSRNAGKLFMPASNQKLLTGALALTQLGADHRFETRLLGSGRVVNGTLVGDLAVLGDGDPSVSDSLAGGDAMAPLRAFADSLRARGIRRVGGRLLRAAQVFPDSTLGFGWAWDDLDFGYSAPVDALTFNEGYAEVLIIGARRVGGRVTVRTTPATTVPRLGRGDVTTAAGPSDVRIAGDVRGRRPLVHLTGTVAPNDTVRLEVALRHPTAAYLDAFAEALRARGITIRGGVDPDAIADTTGMITLATRRSPPLREILPRFEKPSQNQIGELLFKATARARTGVGSADSGRAVLERQLLAWGADSLGFAVRDGSGLSRHDYVTPETIVRVLDAMRRHPEFETFRTSLPVAGVDGTIRTRMRGTSAEGRVFAKTGTLDKARSLSGYVATPDGRLLLFSFLTNNHVASNREADRVTDALASWLAGTPLPSADPMGTPFVLPPPAR
ncbi:MAG: D-alanyl-D-alanine carboxypeptidase/D-alanyl-D-alanine-endopeptidase [Gemmatimonadota bacterium]|nr:D-alanyl-D-alanine carboxypeptidase/D-alanyl-D-alanine-endopeptidase [Gemmatimonadota bacterium]MDQ8148094.1 D-alanyl-D-alanine carboxypeptidase/D-alanyl-D-alanine-endopeptidase [Gemmatimonadota bacterium]MDQ8149886.1 D-alanyl-D-alanine carboxypeptidase/D-alanyl-D-alanine-endopeptidase [Gemmatimonadota bacterium]MDQ8177419.1 D-alanyl-D-alanine carboxypeptidase/D-alanyl-D-alanine-endopeptidase [Gemmatimonadota bacterium]